MISQIIRSITDYSRAISYMGRPWAIKYVILSGIISLLTFIVFILLIFFYGDDVIQPLVNISYPRLLDYGWLILIMEWVVRILFWLIIIFIFKYVVLVVTSPVMSLLSESVEINITSNKIPRLGFRDQLKSMIRGTAIAVSNLFRELLITIPVIILSFIPGFAIGTTPLIMIVQSYFAGFGNFDFFMERRFGIRESRHFMRRHKGMAIGNGFIFLALLFVPLLGVIFAPALATIAATISAIDVLENDHLPAKS